MKTLFRQSDAALAQGASGRITARIRNSRRAKGRDQFDSPAPTGVAARSATAVMAELVEQTFEFVKAQIRVVTGLDTSIAHCEPIENAFPNEVKIAEAVSVFSKHFAAA